MADIDQVKAMIEGSKLDTASGGEGTTEVNELEEYKESVARRNSALFSLKHALQKCFSQYSHSSTSALPSVNLI
jgi:hypothetical protein